MTDDARAALSAPGTTRQQQVSIVAKALDDAEKADVAALLDGGATLSKGARNFLEAVLGRSPLDASLPLLQLNDAGDGRLRGVASPGATIEALNLSTAPTGFARVTDAVELGRADASGFFDVRLDGVQQGDEVRVRMRDAQGATSEWFTAAANAPGQVDLRAAYVNLTRLVVRASSDGTLTVAPSSKDLPLTEPNAVLRFTNTRTGQFQEVRMGEAAMLPAPVTLPGQPGDAIAVAVSDGAGNTDFSFEAGRLTAPGVAPRGDVVDPNSTDGRNTAFRAEGELFVDGVSVHDAKQGQIGNCYVPASLAAVAYADPDAIRDVIRSNGDGTYTVRFFVDGWPKEVTVDADLYGYRGSPRYASSTGRTPSGAPELWVSLVEKGYATLMGGYDVVARGGSVGAMQAALLGRPNMELWTNQNSPDALFAAIEKGRLEGRAMSAGTFGTQESARYSGTGVHANHAYSVLRAETENGKRYVVVRNPWGSGEAGRDGVDDGVFRLELETFARLYQVLNVT